MTMLTEESYPSLISLAVHEFRTPASIIGGYLRMLQQDTDPPLSDRQRRMVDEAARSCARLVAIVTELSDVARLDDGRTTMMRQPFDVFALVHEVAAVVHESAEREVHLKVEGMTAGGQAIGDPSRMRTAFDAIFRSILREQPGPCTVIADCRVAQEDGAGSAVIVVGAAPGVQEAYAAARAPFDDRRGGLGLALPLARRIIDAHGGRLMSSATSTGPGGPAIITLPLTGQHP